MFPVIFKIGPLSIYSYGLLLATAAVVCTFLLSRDAQKRNIDKSVIVDLVFWVIIGGLVGARIFYVFMNVPYFMKHPQSILFSNYGFAWQGSLVAGFLTGIYFIRKHKLPLVEMLDLSAPYIALGQSIGRIGCFLNGCCYGRHVSWGIYFPVHGDHLHPTQLYSTFGLFMIFLVLKRVQKRNPPQGVVFVFYLFLASFLRFGIEFFRADHYSLFFGLSIYQCVCLGIVFFAGIFLKKVYKPRV